MNGIQAYQNAFSPAGLLLAEAHVQKLLAKAKVAYLAGKNKKYAYAANRYFQSWDSRVLATWAAYQSLRPYSRPDLTKLPTIAASLSPFAGNEENVAVIMKKKDNYGNYRIVMDFGIRNRAVQQLVAPLLHEVVQTHTDQFIFRGGLPAAIDRVTVLLKQGFAHAVETDISDCFPSFDGEDLDHFLPLPKKVIDHAVMGKHLNVAPSAGLLHVLGPADSEDEAPLLSDCLASARRGIPHGSAVSSIVAEILLAPVLSGLPSAGRYVNYGDNILSLAKSNEEAVTISKAVSSAIKAHPVGHLQPTQDKIFEPGEYFEFLGHRFRKVGDSVSIIPSLENADKFRQRLKRDLKALKQSHLSMYARRLKARKVRAYIKSWTANFARCDGMPNYRKVCLGQLEKALQET